MGFNLGFKGLTNITGITSKSKHTVKYPNLPSAMGPVSHSTKVSEKSDV